MKAKQLTAAGMVGLMALAPQAALAQPVHNEDGVTLTLSAGVSGENADDINQVLQTAKLTVGIGKIEEQVVVNVSADALGKNWAKSLLAVDTEQQKLGVSLPGVDERLFTVTLGELQTVAQEVQGQSALPEEIDPQKQADQYVEILTPYMDTISTYTEQWAQTSEGEIELSNLGETVDGELMTWAPSGEQCAELTNALADQIEADDALAELTGAWADYLQNVKDLQSEGAGKESADGIGMTMHAGALGIDADTIDDDDIDLLRNFTTQAPDKMRETAKDMAEVEEPGISVSIGSVEDKLVLADMHIGDEGDVNGLRIESYDGQYALTATEDGQEELNLTGVHNVDGEECSGAFTLTIDDADILDGDYAFDTSECSMLYMPYGYASLRASGLEGTLLVEKAEDGGDAYTIGLNGIGQLVGEEYGVDNVQLTLGCKEGADLEMPEGEEVDLTAYEQADLETLAGEIGQKFLNKWAGNLLGGN